MVFEAQRELGLVGPENLKRHDRTLTMDTTSSTRMVGLPVICFKGRSQNFLTECEKFGSREAETSESLLTGLETLDLSADETCKKGKGKRKGKRREGNNGCGEERVKPRFLFGWTHL